MVINNIYFQYTVSFSSDERKMESEVLIMKEIYIITGADGFLGNNIVRLLQDRPDTEIRAMKFPGDRADSLAGLNCEIYEANILEPESMKAIFDVPADAEVFVIHCAGIVDIRKQYNPNEYNVNVYGTENVVKACEKIKARMIEVSSVHASHPLPDQQLMVESTDFNPDTVAGEYAKTKAAAAAYILSEVRAGRLDAVIVQPAGLIGPNDHDDTHMTQFIAEVCNEKLPANVDEGYNFVDVRDVAQGIISACKKGKKGNAYFLTNKYYTMKQLGDWASEANHSRKIELVVPLWLVKGVLPIAGVYYDAVHKVPLFTPYAIETIESNHNFDNEKAVKELGFTTRPMKETIADTVAYLRSIFMIDKGEN